jgi:hypothetical protein
MYFERTEEKKASVEWAEWKEFGQLYVDTMQVLHELRPLSDKEIASVQTKMDRMKVLFATALTDEGDGTQYFHCMFSGHVRDMLMTYRSLSRVQQQSWEQLMSEMKRMLHRCTTRSGCGQTIVKSIFTRYGRKLMHHLNITMDSKGGVVYQVPNMKPTLEEAKLLDREGDFMGLMILEYNKKKTLEKTMAAMLEKETADEVKQDDNVETQDRDSDDDNNNDDDDDDNDFDEAHACETVNKTVDFSLVDLHCKRRSKSI